MGGGRMTDILNLIPDPKFRHAERWSANDATISVDTRYQRLNVKNTNGSISSFAELILSDVSEYRGVNMTFACTLSWISGNAAQYGDVLLLARENNSIWHTRGDGDAKIHREALQFTLPDDTTSLALRLYAPATKDIIFQWWLPILTRTEDYQRLLNGTATGAAVDYFDGDTRPE